MTGADMGVNPVRLTADSTCWARVWGRFVPAGPTAVWGGDRGGGPARQHLKKYRPV